jgi:hypothetical protein
VSCAAYSVHLYSKVLGHNLYRAYSYAPRSVMSIRTLAYPKGIMFHSSI